MNFPCIQNYVETVILECNKFCCQYTMITTILTISTLFVAFMNVDDMELCHLIVVFERSNFPQIISFIRALQSVFYAIRHFLPSTNTRTTSNLPAPQARLVRRKLQLQTFSRVKFLVNCQRLRYLEMYKLVVQKLVGCQRT